jgi:hypothetical protein
MADHSILLARRSDTLGRFCRCAIVPSVLIAFSHFSELCILLGDLDQLLQLQIVEQDIALPKRSPSGCP